MCTYRWDGKQPWLKFQNWGKIKMKLKRSCFVEFGRSHFAKWILLVRKHLSIKHVYLWISSIDTHPNIIRLIINLEWISNGHFLFYLECLIRNPSGWIKMVCEHGYLNGPIKGSYFCIWEHSEKLTSAPVDLVHTHTL